MVTRAGCDRNQPSESGCGCLRWRRWRRLRPLEPAQMLWYTLRLSIATPLQPMATEGLRARKKARTRQLIADCAARLFAERGYENIAVSDVAREADVAEQTVYNYFPTKEQLVTDREQQIQERLCLLIRSRLPGSTPAAAIREFVLRAVVGIRDIPSELWRG